MAVICLLGVQAEIITFEQRSQRLSAELTQLQTSARNNSAKDVTQKTTAVNATVNILATALGTPRAWAKDGSSVLSILPANVTVQKLTLQDNGQIQLTGLAKTRAVFLALQEALTSSPILQNVTTSSTASKKDDVPFDYQAALKAPAP
jgi:Tfp pilus assembly protein PilN